jgi:hypothetical protein
MPLLALRADFKIVKDIKYLFTIIFSIFVYQLVNVFLFNGQF